MSRAQNPLARRSSAARRSRPKRDPLSSVGLRPSRVYTNGGEVPFLNVRPIIADVIHTHVSMQEVRAFHTTSTTLETFSSTSFNVSSFMGDATTLSNVFDQYRIIGVEMWFTPRTPLTLTDKGLMTTVIDFDDSTSLTTVAGANDYATALAAPGSQSHYRALIPHAAVGLYNGAFTGYGNLASPWVDAASLTVQHYGIKCASTLTGAIEIWDATFRLVTQWKNTR